METSSTREGLREVEWKLADRDLGSTITQREACRSSTRTVRAVVPGWPFLPIPNTTFQRRLLASDLHRVISWARLVDH